MKFPLKVQSRGIKVNKHKVRNYFITSVSRDNQPSAHQIHFIEFFFNTRIIEHTHWVNNY